jgi:hypothetical protein
MKMRVTINVSAADLARAYLDGNATGGKLITSLGLTSLGRPIHIIHIARSTRKITLSGVIKSNNPKVKPFRWEETYSSAGAPIDD